MKSRGIILIFLLSFMILYSLMIFRNELTAQNINQINLNSDDIFIDGEEEDDEKIIRNIQRINAKNENVFFVETQNLTEHKLNERQACSIESAAFMNPNATIFVIFQTPTHYVNLTTSTFVETLRQYRNVKFKFVNIKDFAKNTPLERWIESDELINSKFVVSHTSDVLRYLLLYKYSGLYLDMDVIVTSPYGQINLDNFACSESSEFLNGAVLKLTGSSGRKLAETFLIETLKNFNGEVWGSNGPHLLTRLIKNSCNISKFPPERVKKCENFSILPPSKCYAVGWQEWEKFFEANQLDYVRELTKDSFFVHLWNHFSDSRKLRKDDKTGLNEIAAKYCPKIYATGKKYF